MFWKELTAKIESLESIITEHQFGKLIEAEVTQLKVRP